MVYLLFFNTVDLKTAKEKYIYIYPYAFFFFFFWSLKQSPGHIVEKQ